MSKDFICMRVLARLLEKKCILCSALHHKSYLRLPYVTSLRDSFCPGAFMHSFLLPSHKDTRLLIGNKLFDIYYIYQ